MWKLLLLMALPLAPLGAIHGGAPAGPADIKADAPLRCEIRTTPVSGGVELAGIAAADRPLSGTYELDVRKTGGGGTSNTMQGGEFELRPGEDAIVSVVGLGLEGGASFNATLVLRWKGGEVSCSASGAERA